jgi:hypothetical protein
LTAVTATRHHAKVRVATGIVALLIVCVIAGLAPVACITLP